MTDADRQFNGNLINDLARMSDAIFGKWAKDIEVCRSLRCPVTGLHNTDECAELIRQAKEEERG